jgi:hypothetical protein
MERLPGGDELCKVIRQFADLEWSKCQFRVVEVVLRDGRVCKQDNSSSPPFTTVRFREKDVQLAGRVKQAIDGYKGGVKWSMFAHQRESFSNVNWIIRPEFVVKILREEVGSVPMDSQKYMSEHYPDFAPLAYADLRNLAKHVENAMGSDPKR